MPHNPTKSDLQREVNYKAKQVAHQWEKGKRVAARKASAINPLTPDPSTMTEIGREFEDLWKDDIKPAMAKLNVNVRREMSELGKDINDLIQSNETTASIAKGFSDLSKRISKNPVMKSLGNFCSKMGKMVTSLAGTSKDRSRAWKDVKTATAKVKTEITKAVSSPSQSHAR